MRFNGEPYVQERFGRGMERFAVKRGLEKKMGGNAGLAKLAATYFDEMQVDANGVFIGTFGIMTHISGEFDGEGKLALEVQQLKGSDLSAFLSADGGREQAMESRKRYSSFLDEATGYTPKQRGDKAKEEAKKFSKAKSAIKMAHKTMEMSSSINQETIDKAHAMIAELESMIESGTAPSEGKVKKLNDLL
jgi:hypothetical protein